MKDTELTTELSNRLNWEKQEVEAMLTMLGLVMGEKLGLRDSVYISKLGQFEAKKIDEHSKFNPANGVRYLIPPKLTVRFRPVVSLKAYLKTLDDHA